jgi:hypothetical protein
MRKLKLEVETLNVQSFAVTGGRRPTAAGTVHGHQNTGAIQCGPTHTDPTTDPTGYECMTLSEAPYC